MIEKVEKFFIKYDLAGAQKTPKTYLIGFSGGYDSMCLLDILNKMCDHKLVALHLNHNWRGDEAKVEEENCKKFCEERNIEFISETLNSDTKKTETAAREARQLFFKKYYKKYNADGLFLAHTKSDNTETIVYRMVQGTGVNGLCGIFAQNEIMGMEIFRPLINCTREEIEDYCSKNHLEPNHDSSNEDTRYKRNFIRHAILPKLKEMNTNLDESIMRLSEIAASEKRILDEYMNILETNLKLKEGDRFKTPVFMGLSEDLRKQFILNLLVENGFDYDSKKIDEIFAFINLNQGSKTGKTHSLDGKNWLFINTKEFYIIQNAQKVQRLQNDTNEVTIDSEGEYVFGNKIFKVEKYTQDTLPKFPKENEFCAYVSNLDFPLTLRYRNEGDTIQPFGMQGSMKLKKYLINKNVPKFERDGIIMLCKNSEVLWACGCGLSEKLRAAKVPQYMIKTECGCCDG